MMDRLADAFAFMIKFCSDYEEELAWFGVFVFGFMVGAWVF